MQIKPGSSRYPKDLVEKFTIHEEDARKYVPSEDSTLVINFVEHWKISAERKGSKRFSPFKNSLTEQFGLVSYDITRTRELITFLWSSFYRMQSKTSRTVYMSHPSFFKTYSPEDTENLNLENVVLRYPLGRKGTSDSDSYDLVLMGDIVTRADRKLLRKEFVVKGFSLLGSSSHHGEILVRSSLILRVMNSSMEGFYTPKGELAEGIPLDVYGKSAITPGLLSELSESYVVKDPNEVIRKLSEWQDFLNNERKHAETQDIGYPIEKPEFFLAYRIPTGTELHGEHVLVETTDAVWTDTVIPDGDARVIVRITHTVDPRVPEKNAKYVEGFNTLATSSVKIIDPLEDMSEGSSKTRENEKRMSRIGGEYLNTASVTGLLPEEVTSPFRVARDEAIAEARECFEKSVSEYAESELRAFAESDVYSEMTENLPREDRERMLGEKMIELSSVASERFLPTMKAAVKAANNRFSEEIDRLYKGADRCRLTMFYEIPLSRSMSSAAEAEERSRYYNGGRNYMLVSDQIGTVTNITRQMDAVMSFLRGEMANPYLASYLFDSDSQPAPRHHDPLHLIGRNFNDLQSKAINEAVFSNGIYLIQGPPGTGKTQVISEITAQEALKGRKVLITSQNNKAIDNAFDRLLRSPLIRPIRIMSENKESDYDLSHIVSTFYGNIGKSLADRIDIYNDTSLKTEVSSKLSEIKELFSEYEDCRDDAEDTLEEIQDDIEDIEFLSRKAEDIRKEIEEGESRRKLLEELSAGLTTFELTTYAPFSKEIKDIFAPYVHLVSGKGTMAAESEMEGKLFGKYGYCTKIMSLTYSEFAEQTDLIAENKEYADLMRKLYLSENEVEKSKLTKRIDEYIAENGINTDEFRLLDGFHADLPDNLPQIRYKLSRITLKADHLLRTRTEQLSDVSAAEEKRKEYSSKMKKVEDIRDELEELYEEKEYITYKQAEEALMKPIGELFERLGINDRYDSPEEAYRILELRLNMFTDLNENDLALTKSTFEEICAYLGKEGVDKHDHDHLMKELRNYVNVVGITCTAEGTAREDVKGDDDRLILDATTMGIDTVIIDEVSKVPFPELLRPMLSGKRVIMVGDHKQLSPLYNVKVNEHTQGAKKEEIEREIHYKHMYETPLFEELFDNTSDGCKTMLRKQYRMTGQIMGAINRFYGSQLEMGTTDGQRAHGITIPGNGRNILDAGTSILFINCKGTSVRREGSTSYENILEAKVVSKVVELLENNCRYGYDSVPVEECGENRKMSIGIISPYASQNRLIRRSTTRFYDKLSRSGKSSAFRTVGEERFSVKSVDDFQGDERDIIILSLVRDSKSAFISNPKRINVAMSRARRLLILVGDGESLMEGEVEAYKEIINDIKEHGGYLEASDILEVQ